VKTDVINFITQELDRVRNDKEYREQVIERKIGATILPLILALPRNCNITVNKGNRKIKIKKYSMHIRFMHTRNLVVCIFLYNRSRICILHTWP